VAEVKVAQASLVASGTGTVGSVEGSAIAAFNVGGTFYANRETLGHHLRRAGHDAETAGLSAWCSSRARVEYLRALLRIVRQAAAVEKRSVARGDVGVMRPGGTLQQRRTRLLMPVSVDGVP